MKAGQDSNSAAATDRVTAHHSVVGRAPSRYSLLVPRSLEHGAATAFPVAELPTSA